MSTTQSNTLESLLDLKRDGLPPSKRPEGPSFVALSVVVGAIFGVVTNLLPGGLQGGDGFFVGFAISLSFYAARLTIINAITKASFLRKFPVTVQCPECGRIFEFDVVIRPVRRNS